MMLRIFQDPELLSALEADLASEYGVDLYSFFRGEMYFRRLQDFVLNLPPDSRLAKRSRNDPIDTGNQLLMTIIDNLNFLNYQTYYLTGATVGKGWKKIISKAPKPLNRPKYIEDEKVEEKPRFLSGRELREMMGRTAQKHVVAHTAICVQAGTSVNDGVTLRCSCPHELVKPKEPEEV